MILANKFVKEEFSLMKKRLSKAREIYLCGIEWNYEFLFQRMYMALLIIGCMFLKNFSIRTNIIYILLHVVSLYFFGYKKSMWECSLREKIYQTLYFISNIIIIGVSIFQGKTRLILITIGLSSIFAGILGLIILFFTDRLIISGREYTEKMEIYNQVITLCLSVLFLVIGLLVVGSSAYELAFITAIYVILIPFINVGEDNCMNFYEFFEIL